MHRKNLNFVEIAYMLFTVLFLLASAGVNNVHAEGELNHLLKGDYSFSQTITCVWNVAGFVGDNNQLPADGTEGGIQTLTRKGIMHFNGDGTARSESISLSFNHSATLPGNFPVSGSDTHCDFTYNVNPDRSFSRESALCTGTMLSGSPLFVGKSFNFTAEQFGTGQIGVGSQMLLLSGTDASIQNVTFPDFFPGVDVSWDRICNYTGTAIKLP